MAVYADRYCFFPVRRGIVDEKNPYMITPTDSILSGLSFFNYQISPQTVRAIWIALKS
jgi:hypothetical protein